MKQKGKFLVIKDSADILKPQVIKSALGFYREFLFELNMISEIAY